MQALSDTIPNMVGTGGSVSAKNATAVAFDPRIHPSSLVINGQQVARDAGRRLGGLGRRWL